MTPNERHVGANELVSGLLASEMGLPVLDVRVLSMGGDVLAGSTWMGGRFHPYMDATLFEECINRYHVYGIVVFDLWVCNTDRHEGGLIARCSGTETPGRKQQCGWDRHALILNDHSHCLLPDNRETTYFGSLLNHRDRVGEFVQLPFLLDAIQSPEMLGQAIGRAEAIPNEMLEGIIRQVPDALLPAEDKPAWVEFLSARRDRLREIVTASRRSFRNLEAGDI